MRALLTPAWSRRTPVGARKPDLVLLDLGLPDIDGYEVARRIRGLPGGAGARLIAVSGYRRPRVVAYALAAGSDDHVIKPVDLPRLLHRLADRTSTTIVVEPATGQPDHARRWGDGASRRARGGRDAPPDGPVHPGR